jgi:hypothetical protein
MANVVTQRLNRGGKKESNTIRELADEDLTACNVQNWCGSRTLRSRIQRGVIGRLVDFDTAETIGEVQNT